MKSAVTISLVPEARGGPFVFHGDFEAAVESAAALGFSAVEIFPRSAAAFPSERLRSLVGDLGLAVAAVGTGAGWLVEKLHLCHADVARRRDAIDFVRGIMEAAREFAAPAIIGSMQGKVESGASRADAIGWLADSLHRLDDLAQSLGSVLLFEPLNRYETNLFNRQEDAAKWCGDIGLCRTKLLCDLFHMNIEEPDLALSLVRVGSQVGHVHWADSNRWAMGFGHTAPGPILDALGAIGYEGYLSAEVLPLPDAVTAAKQTIASLQGVL